MFHLRKHIISKTSVLLSAARGMNQVELELSHRYHHDEYAECASRRVITAGVMPVTTRAIIILEVMRICLTSSRTLEARIRK